MIPAPDWTPSNRQYHSSPGWSASRLADFRTSPRLAYGYYVTGELQRPKPTPEMRLGSAVHAIFAERWAEEVVIADCTRRHKAWQDWEEKHGETHLLLDESEAEAAQHVADSIILPQTAAAERANQLLLELPGHSEYAYRWTDKRTGVDCKLMLDKLLELPDGRPCIVEMKTDSKGTDPDRFARTAYDWGYHCQAAHNLSGVLHMLGVTGMIPSMVVVLSTKEPYEVAVYDWGDSMLLLGERRTRETLAQLGECIAGKRPWAHPHETLENDIPVLEPPYWALRELQRPIIDTL